MSKFFLFSLLWWLTGSPLRAILVLLVIFYFIDRKFIGLSPSLIKPFRRNRRLSALRVHLRTHPHDSSSKLEAAHLMISKKQYKDALELLEQVRPVMDDSAEVVFGLGLCQLNLGRKEEGELLLLESLRMNPRVSYGEPYLRLGEAYADDQPDKAAGYLEQFRELNTSSCEAYYRLGKLYEKLNRPEDARNAFREALDIYRGLPKYKKRSERRWALLSFFQKK